MQLQVKNVELIINEYDMKLQAVNKENILLKAYILELQESYRQLQEELKSKE